MEDGCGALDAGRWYCNGARGGLCFTVWMEQLLVMQVMMATQGRRDQLEFMRMLRLRDCEMQETLQPSALMQVAGAYILPLSRSWKHD